MLKDKIQRENGVENETISKNQFAVSISMNDLSVIHLTVNSQKRALCVLSKYRESFFRTTLLHTLQTNISLIGN